MIAEFDLTTDPAVAAQDVRDKVAALKVGFRDEVEEPLHLALPARRSADRVDRRQFDHDATCAR